jgi:hypothetical protein
MFKFTSANSLGRGTDNDHLAVERPKPLALRLSEGLGVTRGKRGLKDKLIESQIQPAPKLEAGVADCA